MGKQVGFFSDDTDLHHFLAFAEECGFLALPDLVETDEEASAVAPTTMNLPCGTDESCFHLLPPGIPAAEAFYREVVDQPGTSRLMKHVSPVTEVRPCRREAEVLFDGRIHFNMDSHVSHFDQGYRGYQRLARYFHKWKKTKRYRFRVGPHTAEAVAKGQLKLFHWHEEMTIEQ
jgi:hypothetical protein